ncbi:hypothetical protein [Amycolatopsis suaedae]|uniref:Glycosyltransferase RgtA/B/C/D-like domain-containing protein n=1 Tax=Amycolatopsis suaedae TaxID=2510978 RepID=A0A4Q7J6T5_9PSEU|nr:hypothetical protein [Amycolatopsis suaedae]RZQ62043.1 hypothetical protein EWH70_20865 [Amycolatopsis suaedae]
MRISMSAEDSTVPVPVSSARQPNWALGVGVAIASAVVFAVASTHLVDDAYITLTYAENLALRGHWGLIDHGAANTATSPLNVLALASITVLTRDAVLAAGVLFVLSAVLLAYGLRRLGRMHGLAGWFAPVTLAAVALNPLLLSSLCLELMLGVAAASWLLVYSGERRAVAFGAVAGVLALIRLDLLIIAVVVFAVRKRFWSGIWRTTLTALVVAGPWFLYSWLVLGSAVPDTLIIKTMQGDWARSTFAGGPLLYLDHYPAPTVLAFLPVVTALLAGLLWTVLNRRGSVTARRMTPFAVLALGGLAHFLAYVWLNVPPYHWYYVPSVAAATVFSVATVAALDTSRVRRLVAGAGLAATVALLAANVALYVQPGIPREFAPISANHASSAQYLRIGEELAGIVGERTIRGPGEIGALAYGCRCEIVDVFSDRGAVGLAIERHRERASALGRAFLDLNFRFFDHSVAPAPADLVLETGAVPPPSALASWTISSPWSGSTQLYLVPAGEARTMAG